MGLKRWTLNGESWDWDADAMTFREGMDLEKYVGLTVVEFTEGLSKGRAICFMALIWLARRANGEVALKFSELGGGAISTFKSEDLDEDGNVIPDEPDDPEAEAEAEIPTDAGDE